MANNEVIYTDQAQQLEDFWANTLTSAKCLQSSDFKTQDLPLARIKKIMKLDEDVKMISAEAPVLFAKACEIFINELTLRAWTHTEENKRRTLQRNDIAMAISKFDQFDFLIDIVPRDELKPAKRTEETQRASLTADQAQYYFQLVQQHQQQSNNLNQQPTATPAPVAPVAQTQQIQLQGNESTPVIQQPFQVQIGGQTYTIAQPNTAISNSTVTEVTENQPQIVQVQSLQGQTASTSTEQQINPIQQITLQQPTQQSANATTASDVSTSSQQNATTQVIQQVLTPSGEVQNIPISLTQAQLQAIQMQMQGKSSNQPIIIQTSQANSTTTQASVQNTQTADQASQGLFQFPIVANGQQLIISEGEQSDNAIEVSNL